MQLSSFLVLVKAVSADDSMALASSSSSSHWHSRSWIVDGCAKVGERQLDQHLDKKQLAPVRCCSFHNSCHSAEIGCVQQSYSDAKQTCAKHGMRLCSWFEMKTNLCCGTGCNFDLQSAWVLRDSYGKKPSEFDPNSYSMALASSHWHSSSWTVDGCAKVGERQLDQHLDKKHLAPVRCCSFHNSCHSAEIGCVKQSYSDAKHTCAKHGMRLCSWYEMKTNLCCGTGCNFDLQSAWVLRDSYGKKPSEFDPNSQGSGKAWLLDGCPKVGERNLDQEVDEYKTAPVRCCSHSKASCYSKEIGCIKQTYFDAQHTCAKHGMRLCTYQEMKTNLCCGTGCNFDLESAWISSESYPRNELDAVRETNITTLV